MTLQVSELGYYNVQWTDEKVTGYWPKVRTASQAKRTVANSFVLRPPTQMIMIIARYPAQRGKPLEAAMFTRWRKIVSRAND